MIFVNLILSEKNKLIICVYSIIIFCNLGCLLNIQRNYFEGTLFRSFDCRCVKLKLQNINEFGVYKNELNAHNRN